MNSQYPLLTQLLEELVAAQQNKKDIAYDKKQDTTSDKKNDTTPQNTLQDTTEKDIEPAITLESQPPIRYLRSAKSILSEMVGDVNKIPNHSNITFARFIKGEYVKQYKKNPLQLEQSRACYYKGNEIKFVKSIIKKYLETKIKNHSH